MGWFVEAADEQFEEDDEYCPERVIEKVGRCKGQCDGYREQQECAEGELAARRRGVVVVHGVLVARGGIIRGG